MPSKDRQKAAKRRSLFRRKSLIKSLFCGEPGRGGASVLLLLACLALACAFGPRQSLADSMESEHTQASWYGTTAHGKLTANGETFNRYNLTVAHKSLPFGVVLRVKNLVNGRQVLVRVNDRGPYIPGRTLDVSLRAAIALKMVDSGVAPVSYEIVSNRKGVPLNKENAFYIHIANVRDQAKARAKAEALADKYQCSITIIPTANGKNSMHALCIGPFRNFKKAQAEFLRHEKENVSFRGIIEGPAKPAETTKRALAVKKEDKEKTVQVAAQASGALPNLGKSAAQALCSNSLQKSVGLLDMAMGAFFGIHAQQPALSHHYSALSDCPDFSM